MGTLPTLKPRKVVALLEGWGFAEVRQNGSHKQLRHADGSRDDGSVSRRARHLTDLLRKIAKDIGLTAEQLVKGLQGA